MNQPDRLQALQNVVEKGFSGFLLLGFALGVALPPLPTLPGLVPSLLAGVLFIACARITPSDLRHVAPLRVAAFYVLRFLLVPVLLWTLARRLFPSLATPVLLLGLLPTGVTAPAITAILRGNPALALAATTLSTAAAPLTIPTGLMLLADADIAIDVRGITTTLVTLLLVPTLTWFGVARHSERLRGLLTRRGGLFSVVLICTIAVFVANDQRERILADPLGLVVLFLGGLGFYVLAYAIGLASAGRGPHRERVAWALSSGNHNIVLGVTLALLHLPDAVVPLVAWDLAWIVGLSAIQPVLRALEPEVVTPV